MAIAFEYHGHVARDVMATPSGYKWFFYCANSQEIAKFLPTADFLFRDLGGGRAFSR